MSAKPKLLITDGLYEPGLEILNASGVFEITVLPSTGAEKLLEIISEYDAVILHVQTKLTRGVLERARKLKFIGCASVGFDHVDVVYAKERKIHVASAAGANAGSVGDLALSYILTFARRLPECRDDLRADGWNRKGLTGFALEEKVLGLLGAGNTGRATAKRAAAFGMKVVAYDPLYKPGTVVDGISEFLFSKEDVLREADIVSCHVPLDIDTRGLLSLKDFQMMKKGSYVLNTSRGGVVVEDDIHMALDSGHIAGYGVDVFTVEPLPAGNWMRSHSKVVGTHHLGGATLAARQAVAKSVAFQALEFFKA